MAAPDVPARFDMTVLADKGWPVRPRRCHPRRRILRGHLNYRKEQGQASLPCCSSAARSRRSPTATSPRSTRSTPPSASHLVRKDGGEIAEIAAWPRPTRVADEAHADGPTAATLLAVASAGASAVDIKGGKRLDQRRCSRTSSRSTATRWARTCSWAAPARLKDSKEHRGGAEESRQGHGRPPPPAQGHR